MTGLLAYNEVLLLRCFDWHVWYLYHLLALKNYGIDDEHVA